ncbi:MAG: EamA family transporter [Actinobacteria bacterium]|jgi:drug/metabolite transporter (DMT)-like permease|nr:EamA family transporter [Actinomycetota bacterium]
MNPSGTRRQAILFLVLTAILWSSSGLLVKIISWQPLSILSGRSILSSVVFWIFLKYPTRFNWTRLQVTGAVAYVGAQIFFIMATKLTTAANAIFLQYTLPIYIVLFGYWFLNERPQRADWISLIVIFAGLFLFFGDDLNFDGFSGNILAIVSGMAMALLMLCMRKQKDGTPANTILLGNILGAVIGLPFLFQESYSLPNLGIIAYLGIFQIGLSFVLYSIAIKQVQALEATLILTLEPILNPLWVFLVIGETPGKLALIGGMFVIGAVTARAVVSARAVAV